MKSKMMLLLGTFLKSTSGLNILKYSSDKKKRSNITANYVGFGLLYLVLLAYCIFMSLSLNSIGMGNMIPDLCAGIVVAMSFFFTLLKSNGYLYGFKEYDMLIAMPFTEKDIVSAKFLYMYIKSMPLMLVLSYSMLIGYMLGGNGNALSVVLWVVLTLALPIVPMLLASIVGAVIVRIGSGFEHKKVIQMVLTFVLIIPVFFLRFFIEQIIRDDSVMDMVEQMTEGFDSFTNYVPMAEWFVKAINENSILFALLLIVVSVALFEIAFVLISKSYRKVNSMLSANGSKKKYKMTSQKQRSMVNAIVFKEFKRLIGSTVYATNVGIGLILIMIVAIIALFVKAETIIGVITQGAPLTPEMLLPSVPLLSYFFLGMMPTTCCSPSLEGKNYWIMKSLPIDPMDDAKGKILFNMYFFAPAGIFATLAFSFSARTSVVNAIAGCVVITALCAASSIYGLRCGIKHRELDWENEVEVVKQGSAIFTYLLPNMIISMILIPGVIILNLTLNNVLLIYTMLTVIALILTGLSWLSVKKLVKKGV